MRIFRRERPDLTEQTLRNLSKAVSWVRPSLEDAETPSAQLEDLTRQLCEGIDAEEPSEAITALAMVEEVLASLVRPDVDPGGDVLIDPELDSLLSLDLIEPISNWCSWPETPEEAVAALDAALRPLTRRRWNGVRAQGEAVAQWMRDGEYAGSPHEPGALDAITDDDLRFVMKSSHQYIDETVIVGPAERLAYEKEAGDSDEPADD